MAKKQKRKQKVTLSQKLIRIIALVLVFIMVSIIFLTYKGLDVLYLTLAGVESFLATYEIELWSFIHQTEILFIRHLIKECYHLRHTTKIHMLFLIRRKRIMK